jgi:hypothetical protein
MLLLIGAGLVLAAAWAVSVKLWPFRSCQRCDGAGKLRSPNGRSWRTCPRCGGSGARLRRGARG